MPVTRSKTQLKINYAAAVAGANDDTNQLLSASRQAFIDWAVENAVPIERLTPNDYSEHSDNTIHNAAFFQSLSGAIQSSSASVVMLSEGFHNCREMMTLHHAVIEYLVDNLGFTVVASESGLPESRVISNFLQNLRKLSSDKEDEFWAKGLNKIYSAWAEGRDLIEWMIVCNVAQLMRGRDNFVDYCGLDIGGFYSDWTHPISMIQRYIKQHFPHFERNWSQQINPLLYALGTSKARYNYQHVLTATEKNKLALLLDELVNMMSSKRDELEGDLDFEWTRQSAISVSAWPAQILLKEAEAETCLTVVSMPIKYFHNRCNLLKTIIETMNTCLLMTSQRNSKVLMEEKLQWPIISFGD